MEHTPQELATIPARIKGIYLDCSPDEQAYLRQILEELSLTGTSKLYDDLWLADYKEIPVDIDTFLTSDTYLGKTNRNGEGVYPFWRNTLHEIFNAGNRYNEIALTGATRIGKTSTAITGAAYMLYKLMCLRNPQEYFGKKDVSQFSILFFNITQTLAKGVAFREFNDTLKGSPWFNAHGRFSRSEENFYYIPEGGKISIDYGSSGAHGLGKQVYCLVGDTKVLTDHGVLSLRDLSLIDTPVKFAQYSYNSHKIRYTSAYVARTRSTHTTCCITVDDGTRIEGTLDHKLYTIEGYKTLDHIEVQDILVGATSSGLSKIGIVTHKTYHTRNIPIDVYDVINARPYHNFMIAGVNTNNFYVSHNCAIMDEMNFSQAGIQDIQKAKSRMKDTYNTISARIKGTFRKQGEVHGKLFAVSSKKSDSDFMEDYIRTTMSSGGGDHMYVVDRPQWEILPASMFHKETFYIAVGDRHLKGFVVPDNQTDEASLSDLRKQGFTLMTPPIDMRPEFNADFDIALRDLAGVSVPGSLSFITQDIITACINKDRRNPFFNDIIEVGVKDKLTIQEFYHSEVVDARMIRYPLFIHLDLSLNGDKTGMSGVWKYGHKDIPMDDYRTIAMPTFIHAFSVSIQAPRGDRIPYSKIIAFIKWLRKSGYNIQFVTRDQYQSEYVGELLEESGIQSPKISLDRTPDGYNALRSVLLEERIDMLDVQQLQDELIHLQRDAFSGKIDHPLDGCFTGDTKILLADGRQLTIIEMIAESVYRDHYVYTVNEKSGKVEVKRVLSVHPTKIAHELVQITLYTGKLIHCTPDHRFMLEDGSYLAAEFLTAGGWVRSRHGAIRVKSVKRVQRSTCVFDLSIQDNPNFVLACGPVVHNSKDQSDSFAGAVWKAIMESPVTTPTGKRTVNTISMLNTPRRITDAQKLPSVFGNLNSHNFKKPR